MPTREHPHTHGLCHTGGPQQPAVHDTHAVRRLRASRNPLPHPPCLPAHITPGPHATNRLSLATLPPRQGAHTAPGTRCAPPPFPREPPSPHPLPTSLVLALALAGFLTAVLQTKARKSQVPIDTLSFEFTIINLDEAEITAPPREGVYVKGLFLEVRLAVGAVPCCGRGCGRDRAGGCWGSKDVGGLFTRQGRRGLDVHGIVHVAGGGALECKAQSMSGEEGLSNG